MFDLFTTVFFALCLISVGLVIFGKVKANQIILQVGLMVAALLAAMSGYQTMKSPISQMSFDLGALLIFLSGYNCLNSFNKLYALLKNQPEQVGALNLSSKKD